VEHLDFLSMQPPLQRGDCCWFAAETQGAVYF
jgi:hypothetical protein